MLLVSYDISDDRLRAKFAKLLSRYGHRVQYSVFEIRNSPRLLQIIMREIEHRFSPLFTGADSVLIIPVSPADRKKVVRYGFAKNDEEEVLVFQ